MRLSLKYRKDTKIAINKIINTTSDVLFKRFPGDTVEEVDRNWRNGALRGTYSNFDDSLIFSLVFTINEIFLQEATDNLSNKKRSSNDEKGFSRKYG